MKKRNSEMTNTLDDIKSQDPKKRMQSTIMIKQVANAIGPSRTRSQLITFLLNECVEDDQQIVNSLLDQLKDFTSFIGGQQHQKCLVPLLIAFCKIDQRVPADKSIEQLIPILQRNHDIIADTIKKIGKTDIVISKDCAAKLIASQLHNVSSNESESLIQLYNSIVVNENPAVRKTGAKHLKELLSNTNSKFKDQIGKMFENIYNDVDDLPKLLALTALIEYYQINPNVVLSKLKNLIAIQSWRINLKICDLIDIISSKFNKTHFKTIVQPAIFKFLSSTQPQVKAAGCKAVQALAKHLSEQQIKTKLMPILKTLSQDQSLYVKKSVAQNILKLCSYASKQTIKDSIIPLAMEFMKSTNFQLSIGIMNNFEILSGHISQQIFQQNILKKVTYSFDSDNWRLKCQAIELISKILQNPSFLNSKAIQMIMELASDRIDAVRKKTIDLIINIIKKQNKDWVDANLIPQINKLKDNKSYLLRQNAILIVEKTYNKVSESTLNNVYRPLIASLVTDKVPNLRALALNVLKQNQTLIDKQIEQALNSLREEKDLEVKAQLKTLSK